MNRQCEQVPTADELEAETLVWLHPLVADGRVDVGIVPVQDDGSPVRPGQRPAAWLGGVWEPSGRLLHQTVPQETAAAAWRALRAWLEWRFGRAA